MYEFKSSLTAHRHNLTKLRREWFTFFTFSLSHEIAISTTLKAWVLTIENKKLIMRVSELCSNAWLLSCVHRERERRVQQNNKSHEGKVERVKRRVIYPLVFLTWSGKVIPPFESLTMAATMFKSVWKLGRWWWLLTSCFGPVWQRWTYKVTRWHKGKHKVERWRQQSHLTWMNRSFQCLSHAVFFLSLWTFNGYTSG